MKKERRKSRRIRETDGEAEGYLQNDILENGDMSMVKTERKKSKHKRSSKDEGGNETLWLTCIYHLLF